MTQLSAIAFHHDGVELVGRIATPGTSGRHPAVMIMHNAHGLSEMMGEKARSLAALGYVAVAVDMYGGGKYYSDGKSGGAFMMALGSEPERLRARANAWVEQLKARSDVDSQRIAAIGYCFGGMCVLELARSGAHLKAFVSYHGLLTTRLPATRGAVKGQVAIYTGAKDPYAPAEHVEALRRELTAAEAHFQITVFGDAYHAFTDPHANEMGREGIAYDAMADRVSWTGTVALLEAAV
jgi:dienelactone hydrolase